MKAFVVFSVVLAVALGAEDYCYQNVVEACKTTNKKYSSGLNCTSKFGAIDIVQSDIQKFANLHFIRSFEYLMMSTHFANYEKNRPGFDKLFRGLSDDKWEDAIDIIKYLTKRGGSMNFNAIGEEVLKEVETERSFDLYEFTAVAHALGIEKGIEVQAEALHGEATKRSHYDPEISSYIEEEFLHEERDNIRKLAGYATDLNSLLHGPDSSLALFLFDEYLQKQK